MLLKWFHGRSKFIDIMKIHEKLGLTELMTRLLPILFISTEDVLSFLNIFSYNDKKANSS